MRTGIYAGTFDPITIGHLDVIRRSLTLVDKLVVAVASDTGKNCIFSLDDRREMVQATIISDLPEDMHGRIEVHGFSGLLVDFAHKQDASILIRGLRAVSDFEYEFQMACMNSRLADDIETVFLTASEQNHFISSRFIRQVCELGGDIREFTSETVAKRLQAYYGAAAIT